MSADFHEIRLPEILTRGATGGHGWSTEIVTSRGGAEVRNVNWDRDRGRFSFEHLHEFPDEAAILRAFVSARRGAAFGFRLKWPADHTAERVTGDGERTVVQVAVATSGAIQLTKTFADRIAGLAQAGAAGQITLAAAQPEFVLHDSDDAYNAMLIRIVSGTGAGEIRQITDYVGGTKVAATAPAWAVVPGAGSGYQIELFTYPKPIFKPVPGTLQLYVNDALQGGLTLDATTGLVTGVSRVIGDVITAEFDYDNPVRWEADQALETLVAPGWHDFRGLTAIEIQEI